MYCTNCGGILANDANFCHFCGTKRHVPSTRSSAEPTTTDEPDTTSQHDRASDRTEPAIPTHGIDAPTAEHQTITAADVHGTAVGSGDEADERTEAATEMVDAIDVSSDVVTAADNPVPIGHDDMSATTAVPTVSVTDAETPIKKATADSEVPAWAPRGAPRWSDVDPDGPSPFVEDDWANVPAAGVSPSGPVSTGYGATPGPLAPFHHDPPIGGQSAPDADTGPAVGPNATMVQPAYVNTGSAGGISATRAADGAPTMADMPVVGSAQPPAAGAYDPPQWVVPPTHDPGEAAYGGVPTPAVSLRKRSAIPLTLLSLWLLVSGLAYGLIVRNSIVGSPLVHEIATDISPAGTPWDTVSHFMDLSALTKGVVASAIVALIMSAMTLLFIAFKARVAAAMTGTTMGVALLVKAGIAFADVKDLGLSELTARSELVRYILVPIVTTAVFGLLAIGLAIRFGRSNARRTN